MKLIYVKISSLPGHAFSAYDTGNRWNGHICPYFSERQARAFIEAFGADGRGHAEFVQGGDGRRGVSVQTPEGERTFWAVSEYNQTFYPIGAQCWTWQKADPREALSERASDIFESVVEALGPADEIGGPDGYETLMAAIEQEARERKQAFASWKEGEKATACD